VKIHRACHFSLKNQRVFVAKHCVGQALACAKSGFCSDSKVNNLGQISGVPAALGMNYTKVHSAESIPAVAWQTGHDIIEGFPLAVIAFCDHAWTSN
jgi:hypothetical protein